MHKKTLRAAHFFQVLSQPDHQCPERCELIVAQNPEDLTNQNAQKPEFISPVFGNPSQS